MDTMQKMTKYTYEQIFVSNTIQIVQKDKKLAAEMRQALNKNREGLIWNYLVKWNVDITKDYEKIPHLITCYAIANQEPSKNGILSLGKALIKCYPEHSRSKNIDHNHPAYSRLMKLINCENITDISYTIRPILNLITSRISEPLDYERLLWEMKNIHFKNRKIKEKWVQDFYSLNINNNIGDNYE